MNRVGSGNTWGLGLVIVGATALTIATFLPLAEQVSIFGRIQHNTLIQHGGWWIIALALGIAGSGYRAYQHNRVEGLVSLILSIIGATHEVPETSRSFICSKCDGVFDID